MDGTDGHPLQVCSGPVVMFQVGDRVAKRKFVGESNRSLSPTGTIIAINGKWITVKHDKLPGNKARGLEIESPRYDYQDYEIEHINPLLRIVSNL